MRKAFAIALALAAAPAFAQMYGQPRYQTYGTGSNFQSESVGGYTRQNGTYVQPYERSAPNSTQYDNYSARGNVNPYTGDVGTRSPRY